MSETNLARFEPRTASISIADPYTPTSTEQAQQIAQWFAKSGLLAGFKSPEQVFLAMAVGAELGIPPTAAVRAIHVIEGKPTLSADLMIALVLRSPHCEFFRCVETTDERATYSTQRRGEPAPMTLSYSIEDARKAQLVKSGSNWDKRPRVMLRHRAAAELARLVYPDVVLGLYVEGEIPERTINVSVEPLAAAAGVAASFAEPETVPWLALMTEAADREILDGVKEKMKAAFSPGSVPAPLVTAYQARARELR